MLPRLCNEYLGKTLRTPHTFSDHVIEDGRIKKKKEREMERWRKMRG